MIKNIFIITLFIMMTGYNYAQENLNLKKQVEKLDISMFPEAEEGFTRYVIQLDTQNDEDNFQVEIYAGIIAEVDCNKHRLSGEFLKENLKGWGYSYFKFNSEGHIVSTLMACPDSNKQKKIIKSNSELVRYNSKLPIVIYAPNSIQIKYKIWERNEEEWEAVKY